MLFLEILRLETALLFLCNVDRLRAFLIVIGDVVDPVADRITSHLACVVWREEFADSP